MSATCHECGADVGSVGVIKKPDGVSELCPECVRREGVSGVIASTSTSEARARMTHITKQVKEMTDIAAETIERLSEACEHALLFLEGPVTSGRERRDRLIIELRKALGIRWKG